MEHNCYHSVWRFEKDSLAHVERRVVEEYPLRLEVNGRDLATLIASPHQLNFLVAGFLRLQGFIQGLDDLLSLGVCGDFGMARIRIRGEVPERLIPTLTSGCGTGIVFHHPSAPAESTVPPDPQLRFTPQQIFALMRQLAQKAESYRAHGGIHSAAVGDGQELLLYAEDIGRHNTLDRLAGEALFKDLDLRGKLLVTSGRVSTEMVAKAERLGIALIASRTSPTNMAIRIADQAGIALVGYVRGETLEVYSHVNLLAPVHQPRHPPIAGEILMSAEPPPRGLRRLIYPVTMFYITRVQKKWLWSTAFYDSFKTAKNPSILLDVRFHNIVIIEPALRAASP